jgi:enoyl-CoA hydratase/carnithine racemase
MEADHTIRVIIVRSAGRTFSAGYDLTPAKYGDGRAHRTTDDQGRRLAIGIRTGMQ